MTTTASRVQFKSKCRTLTRCDQFEIPDHIDDSEPCNEGWSRLPRGVFSLDLAKQAKSTTKPTSVATRRLIVFALGADPRQLDMSTSQICQMSGIDDRTVRRALSELVKQELVSSSRMDGRVYYYLTKLAIESIYFPEELKS